jgi:V/A-type H+-transporting ATPase subunit E
MGLEKVVGRIKADGAAEADRLLAEARRDAQARINEARAKRDAVLASYAIKAESEVKRLKAREAARTEVEVKKAVLACRKAVLDEAYAAVLDLMKSIPPTERARLYDSLIGKLGPEFAGGKIHCGKRDEGLFASAKGMKVIGDLEAVGGFVVESDGRTIASDARFETLLASVWDRRLPQIASELFSEG